MYKNNSRGGVYITPPLRVSKENTYKKISSVVYKMNRSEAEIHFSVVQPSQQHETSSKRIP